MITTGNRQLLTFIHEMTHHWCFDSIVVNAQRMITIRTQNNALALATLSRDPDLAGPDAGSMPRDGDPPPEESIRLMGALMRAMHGPPSPNNLIAADDLLIKGKRKVAFPDYGTFQRDVLRTVSAMFTV